VESPTHKHWSSTSPSTCEEEKIGWNFHLLITTTTTIILQQHQQLQN
jgi:hypothetical protein